MYTHVYIGNGRLRIESFTSTKSSVKTYVSFANSPNPFPIAIAKKTKTGVFTSRALKACSFFAEYAQKWEQLLVQQRDIFNAAIDQVSQFRGQLLQEEQISRKMTNS